jgi:Putative DNA-binding domain
MRISELFDPAIHPKKASVERHHLFPRAYLATTGLTGQRVYNQIGNMALVEWPDNIVISDKPPADYFPALMERLKPAEAENAKFWHALPAGWEHSEYEDFLGTRRRLMADVIRAGFERLRREAEEPPVDLRTLVDEGEGPALEFKSTGRYNVHSKQRDAELEWVVVKTAAGFANASGGTLLIGIDDEGLPLGLDDDLKLLGKKQDIDGYELWLRDLLEAALGKVITASIAISFPQLEGVVVCRVDVPAAGQPVYANRPKGEKSDDFYLRSGNSTRKLTPQEVVDYLSDRTVTIAD